MGIVPSKRALAPVFALAFAFMGVAHAAADDRPYQIEYARIDYTVDADGRYVESRETATKVLKESALSYLKDASVSYSTSVQKAEVAEAYTLKPDGRKVPAPPGNFQVSAQSGQSGDSPVYSDQSTLTVVFPELAVGDTVVFRYRLTASQPMFEKHFSVLENFSPATYYGDVRVTVDAPATLVSRFQGWKMAQSEATRGDRRVVTWTWRNREPVDPESLRDSVFDPTRYPGYAYSTFSDYGQIAAAYGAKADPKAEPTPRIRKLADELAGDAGDPREIAKRLYEWVARNITYAGNCIGLGAVVPRDLDVVLNNKMGDCKDHATLLQALLKAKGIDSTQALVNAGDTYVLPDIPVASMVNHVLNYVPSLDMYLDSTASTVPFGSLPPADAGKRVLLVHGYGEDTKTPAHTAGRDTQRLTTRVKILADGSVKGSQQLALTGRLAVAMREQFRNMGESDSKQLVKRYFQGRGLAATGAVRYADPVSTSEDFTLEADFDVAQLLAMPGGMQVQPWFVSLAPITSVVAGNSGVADAPAGESNCGSLISEESYELEFPPGFRIAATPKDVALQRDNVTYTAKYQRDGNRLSVQRNLRDLTPGPTCTAEYNTGYRALMREILRDLRSQVVYLPE